MRVRVFDPKRGKEYFDIVKSGILDLLPRGEVAGIYGIILPDGRVVVG